MGRLQWPCDGGCRGHRKEFGFYSKCKEKSLEGFKQGNNVM